MNKANTHKSDSDIIFVEFKKRLMATIDSCQVIKRLHGQCRKESTELIECFVPNETKQ